MIKDLITFLITLFLKRLIPRNSGNKKTPQNAMFPRVGLFIKNNSQQFVRESNP